MTRCRRRILIDGYNLLHRAGAVGPRLRREVLAAARHRLLRRLERAVAWTGDVVTVVFDGQGVGAPCDEVWSGLSVVYADPSIGADIWIERAVTADPSPSEILVVSSDFAVRRSAEAAGAATMSSGEFGAMLDRMDRAQRPPSHGPARRFSPRLGDFFGPGSRTRRGAPPG